MTLEADTNKAGINALARAYNVLIALPELVAAVKHAVHAPTWPLAKEIVHMESFLLDVDADASALKTLYLAMTSKR